MADRHVETLRATCPDHAVEVAVRTVAGVVPARLADPPVDAEPRPAATPNDALDGVPRCPACGEAMEIERQVGSDGGPVRA